jgi:CubicO group peptidase (beta-lactamase class C family)
MNGMRWGVIFQGILLVSCLSTAQTLPPDVTKQVDKVFEKWDKPDSPGCALGVYKDGQIVYKRGYGVADLNDDVPITPATVFHVASMSKQFTAASIVLLAQQGKLSLDDDVRKYIPELPDFGERITIRHLVHHGRGREFESRRPRHHSKAVTNRWRSQLVHSAVRAHARSPHFREPRSG